MKFQPLDLNGFTYAISLLSQKIAEKFNSLAKVARSGNYIDLTNRPEIPPAVSVKGNAETTYRTGEVNLTPENIGIGVMQGATATTAGKAGLVPAPEAGDNIKYLNGAGEYDYLGTLYSQSEVPSEGWYRFIKRNGGGEEPSFGHESGIIQIKRSYSTLDTESYILTFTSAWKNKVAFHCIGRYVNAKAIPKLRLAKDAENLYFELYYSGERQNTITILSALNANSARQFKSVDFEPATDDETVLSEYTIPDRDDIDTSKSLTRFGEIPEKADLNTYITPGNYSCNDSTKAAGLQNCPLKRAFTMEVSYATGQSSYIKQVFHEYSGNSIIIRMRNSSGTWSSPMNYYAAAGTPLANRFWITGDDGVPKWGYVSMDFGTYPSSTAVNDAVKDILLNKMPKNISYSTVNGHFVCGSAYSILIQCHSSGDYGSAILFGYGMQSVKVYLMKSRVVSVASIDLEFTSV